MLSLVNIYLKLINGCSKIAICSNLSHELLQIANQTTTFLFFANTCAFFYFLECPCVLLFLQKTFGLPKSKEQGDESTKYQNNTYTSEQGYALMWTSHKYGCAFGGWPSIRKIMKTHEGNYRSDESIFPLKKIAIFVCPFQLHAFFCCMHCANPFI